jgi:hypothetical protein
MIINAIFTLVSYAAMDIVGKMLVSPIDRCATLIQVAPELRRLDTPAVASEEHSLADAVRHLRRSGIKATFAGAGVAQAVRNVAQYLMAVALPMTDVVTEMVPILHPFRGLINNCALLACIYPSEVIATIAQADGPTEQRRNAVFRSPFSIAAWLGKHPSAAFTGVTAAGIGLLTFRFVIVAVFELARWRRLVPASLPARFALQQGVVMLASVAATPFDTIRRRMITVMALDTERANCNAEERGHPTPVHAWHRFAMDMYRREGVQAFFRGAGVRVLRACAGGILVAIVQIVQFQSAMQEQGSGSMEGDEGDMDIVTQQQPAVSIR